MQRDNYNVSLNKFLLELKIRLAQSGSGKKLADYGFSEPSTEDTELTREQNKFVVDEQCALLEQLNASHPNNPEQEQAFREIMASVDDYDNLTGCEFFLFPVLVELESQSCARSFMPPSEAAASSLKFAQLPH